MAQSRTSKKAAPQPPDAPAPAVDAPIGVTVRERRLEDYALDTRNPNKGGDRSRAILRRSLQERGAGRSILVDKAGRVIAGNQTVSAAKEAGIERAVEIVIPRDVLAVVRRADIDLDSDEGRIMSYEDNQSRSLSSWDASIVAADYDAGLLDLLLFRPDEIDDLVATLQAEADVNAAEEVATGRPTIDAGRERVIRIALYAKPLMVLEQAIKATGIERRADAVLAIAQHYLDTHKTD